ncbi:MAG: cysteine desulfurase-like protein SufS subfamily [Verrucomicrobiaceae bacterium]|nr:cysteine desulfurase-like protein SufS subfamily [Verrucomicrobiaceae bacterium]
MFDEATLNRLAGEFFAALPGSPQSALDFSSPKPPVDPGIAQRAPSLTPSATTQTGVPDVVNQSAPALGRGGNPVLGVPEAYAAALPQISSPPSRAPTPDLPTGISPPTSPYYFLGESSAYPSALPAQQDVPIDDRVSAQSFGLPGAAELKALLSTDRIAQPAAPQAQSGNQSFYFLDAQSSNDKSIPALAPGAHPPFDVNAVRRDFPILQERVNGRPLIWFDNAATTHKPQSVIDRLVYFYAHENSNIHRAAHELAARATDAYEGARNKVARFLGAGSADEIVFVRGATEAINLVAKSWGKQNIKAGDEIIVSLLEHHANIVPWQQLAAETGAKIRVIPVDDSGQILLEEYRRLLNDRTKLVAITQVSNALGTVTPVKEIIDLAHRQGACVLVDGAQAVSHMRVNVQALDADFYVFSGHKVFGPTGIGVVYGKSAILESMPPWQGGGNMIVDVTFERIQYQDAPARFEAGTGNIADAVGLGAAIDYVERIGLENIARYEHDLLVYATQALKTIPGLRLIGTAADKASVASFVLNGYSNEEVGKALNQEGVAVRTGHHCAQPILRRFSLENTVRPSLAFYNTCQEVDVMISVLLRLRGNRR